MCYFVVVGFGLILRPQEGIWRLLEGTKKKGTKKLAESYMPGQGCLHGLSLPNLFQMTHIVDIGP